MGAGVERSEQDAEDDRRTLEPLTTGENEDTKGSIEKDQRREARRSGNPARKPGVKTRRAKLVDLDAAQTAGKIWRKGRLALREVGDYLRRNENKRSGQTEHWP
jgi:hypothetical protein